MNRDQGAWIGTHSGTKFWPLEPRASEINIEDIAHSLARQCRFNGHCGPFFSVAEHSIEVSRNVPEQFALWGLLHDAAETYLSDLVRPLKSRCYYRHPTPPADSVSPGVVHFAFEPYKICEDRILRRVAEHFGLEYPMPQEVETVDDRMLATERAQLFDSRQPHWDALDGIEPYPIKLQCLDWREAEEIFMQRYQELVGTAECGPTDAELAKLADDIFRSGDCLLNDKTRQQEIEFARKAIAMHADAVSGG